MKHLKKFENNNNDMKLTYVNFSNRYDDWVLALYVDGVLVRYGKEEESISEITDGIEIGLKLAGKNLIFDSIECDNEEYNDKVWHYDVDLPEKLEDLDMTINGTKMGLL